MTTPDALPSSPAESLSAPDARPAVGIREDERGAILVMGIFMCACMVSILWYLAGIGDAIIYRERMQEAADATAFSAATLHARGMNLIVMINLIMAAILAVRVVLKVVFIILTAIGIAFSWFPPVGGPANALARVTDGFIKASKPAIDGALKALSAVEGAVARIVPPAAIVGSIQVGNKYIPIVSEAGAGSPVTVKAGLPVENGSPDVLCYEAGKAVVDLIGEIVPIPGAVLDVVGGGFGDLVRAGGGFFCDIGSQGAAPDLSSLINSQADKGCDKKLSEFERIRDEAQADYEATCNSYNAPCRTLTSRNPTPPSTPTATQQAELDKKQAKLAQAQADVDNFEGDKCRKDTKAQAQQQLQSQGSSGGGQKITPKKVEKNWKNGIEAAQMLAVAVGNDKSLKSAPTGVMAGQWKSGGTITIPKTAEFALAQAEFFYDCTGAWTTESCNKKDESAMWNFRWRARLRRYNAPFGGSVPGLDKLAGALEGAEVVQRSLKIKPQNSLTAQNAKIMLELSTVLAGVARDPNSLIIH